MSTIDTKSIGIIGLGLLGGAMSERLLASGFHVTGHDPVAEKREELRALGGEPVDTPQEVWAACPRVLLSLPNSSIAAQVLAEAAPHVRPGTLVVDTTTGDPDEVATFGPQLEALAAGYLDATIGGSSKQVRATDVITMVGGRREHFEACGDIFSAFSRHNFHAGPWGSGARMKLVTNLVLGLNRLVLAEALGFAEASGLDPALALEVLKTSSSYSRVMDIKGRKMLERDYAPEARLSQHLKDVRLILENGERQHARLPLSTLHRALLEEMEERGFGDVDNSAIREAF
ncbi:MAG: NAD(P)-dependent oxidoreductase [Bryobacteraceae bacterium]|jgi:3-hydroxyisobutyrate dehydrogenase-like beta-hydroxyacid dehydrogenase|nr:NAD(P)-dependent oxidoreductase [Bryobacteraceae bacterium]